MNVVDDRRGARRSGLLPAAAAESASSLLAAHRAVERAGQAAARGDANTDAVEQAFEVPQRHADRAPGREAS